VILLDKYARAAFDYILCILLAGSGWTSPISFHRKMTSLMKERFEFRPFEIIVVIAVTWFALQWALLCSKEAKW